MGYIAGSKYACICCHDWHQGHVVQVVPKGGGIGVGLWCTDCRVMGDMQAVGHSIGVASSGSPASCSACDVMMCPSNKRIEHWVEGVQQP